MYDGLKDLDLSARPRRGGRRRVLKRIGISSLVFAIVVLLAGGALFLKLEHNIGQGRRNIGVVPAPKNGALNVLVLGSDKRSVIGGSAREERQFKGGSGQRADTILLIHISKNSDHAVVMSIPRDLWVEIPGHGHSKINAAYSYGGPELMIKTVTLLTGLPINHYVEVNFAGFREIVNDIGGVDIYVNRPLVDPKAGLNIPRPGCIHMNGDVALSFVRSRNIDPTADLGRIQRQQLFIRTLLKKARSAGVILNLLKLDKLTSAVGKNVIYDNGVGLRLARSIANRLSDSNTNRVDFRIVPSRCCPMIDRQSVLVARQPQAQALFAALKADAALPPYGKTSQSIPVPSDIRIKIYNASGIGGLGAGVAAKLRHLGFDIVQTTTAPSRVGQTRITFVVGEDLKAQLVKRYLSIGGVVVGPPSQTTDVIITLGGDAARATASPSPGASPKPPETTSPVSSCG